MDSEGIIFSVIGIAIGVLFLYFAYDVAINKNIAIHTEIDIFTVKTKKNKRKIAEKIALMYVVLGFLYFILPIIFFCVTYYWVIYFIFLEAISIVFFVKISKDLKKLR